MESLNNWGYTNQSTNMKQKSNFSTWKASNFCHSLWFLAKNKRMMNSINWKYQMYALLYFFWSLIVSFDSNRLSNMKEEIW